MLMLVVAYVINDTLLINVEKEGGGACTCSGIIMLSLFIIFLGGDITWIVFQFIEFGKPGCGGNKTQMIITCVAGALMFILVLLRTRSDASLFTSSLVLCYCLFLQWSALSSNPNELCNPYTRSAFNTTFMLIIGLFFTFVSLLVISAATFKDAQEQKYVDNA